MVTAKNETVLKSLSNLNAPVRQWEMDTGTDATGENAVWIWAIVEDATLAHLSQEARARLRDSHTRNCEARRGKSCALRVHTLSRGFGG